MLGLLFIPAQQECGIPYSSSMFLPNHDSTNMTNMPNDNYDKQIKITENKRGTEREKKNKEPSCPKVKKT